MTWTRPSFPDANSTVKTGPDPADIVFATHRRAFLAGAESNPSRPFGQDESRPGALPESRQSAAVRTFPFLTIDKAGRQTSGFREPGGEEGCQVRHMRQVERRPSDAIEEDGREARPDRSPDVVLEVVAHAEHPP